ncbi:DUF1381 domain-containing protein [Staphylococcus gallinarum]|uniref:DUF1381 domain-containing protein n=1 Tax=Staphylococcus gallinarum TaxID=1293 RepID=UPI000D1C2B25|nr:DUF1381 domain-containing protein [Staphylococcus gallinarum]PTE79288.1 DUF1381 domain-containing protein [Staphylococcus gallinarum]
MQYLIRTLTDSTGRTFTHVTKARENETFTVVEAGSEEEAEEKYKAMVRAKVLRQVIKDFKNFKNNVLNKKGQ